MKKNILAVAILAACVANIILSGVILFSIVPAAKNANKLVEKICTAINLELENPDASTYAKVPLTQRETFKVGEDYTVNLRKAEGESKNRFAIFSFSLVLNNKAKSFSDVTGGLANYEDALNDYVARLIKECTADEILDLDKQEEIKKLALSYCRTFFRKDDSENGDELVVDAIIKIMVQ